MINSQQALTGEQQKQICALTKHLHSVFFNNEKFVEALHEMFVAYAHEDPLDEDVVLAYLNLREFLRNSQDLFNPKNK